MEQTKTYKSIPDLVFKKEKVQRAIKLILIDQSKGKLLTPEEKLCVKKHNTEQRIKNKRK